MNEKSDISKLVEEAWTQSGGDESTAADALYSAMTADPALLYALLPDIVRSWCGQQLVDATTTFESGSSQPKLRSVFMESLFDFPLPNGKRLGDASGEEIQEAAATWAASADGASETRSWLEAMTHKGLGEAPD